MALLCIVTHEEIPVASGGGKSEDSGGGGAWGSTAGRDCHAALAGERHPRAAVALGTRQLTAASAPNAYSMRTRRPGWYWPRRKSARSLADGPEPRPDGSRRFGRENRATAAAYTDPRMIGQSAGLRTAAAARRLAAAKKGGGRRPLALLPPRLTLMWLPGTCPFAGSALRPGTSACEHDQEAYARRRSAAIRRRR